jgi:D-alanyl-lipoteichoic acid acyltransferase DltB (MBOAT superfamily)
MAIASHVFLLIFLPFAVLAYYGLFRQARQKMLFLLFASYAFYALADWKFLPLLLLLSLGTFYAARYKWIRLGILVNLVALVIFKYLNFGIESFNALLNALGVEKFADLLQLGLPLGISFYVFKHVGYLLEVQGGRQPAADDFWAFATFSAYFPQISAGPISGYQETAGQFSNLPQKPQADQLYSGLTYMSVGLAKKMLIADVIGSFLASHTNTVEGITGIISAWYVVVGYAMQLYFDFSGYTDLALGVSMLFGVSLPQNFNSPYLAANPAEFWERWHMSLSNWFKYYLFSPISRLLLRKWGTDKRDWAQYAANLSTMALIGLWHGAGWGFILWGLYQGMLLNVNIWWKRRNIQLPSWIGRGVFLLSISFGWALFMSPDGTYLNHLLLNLSGLGGLDEWKRILALVTEFTTPALFVAILLSASGLTEAASILKHAKSHHPALAVLWGLLAALSLLLLSGQINFMYVQF